MRFDLKQRSLSQKTILFFKARQLCFVHPPTGSGRSSVGLAFVLWPLGEGSVPRVDACRRPHWLPSRGRSIGRPSRSPSGPLTLLGPPEEPGTGPHLLEAPMELQVPRGRRGSGCLSVQHCPVPRGARAEHPHPLPGPAGTSSSSLGSRQYHPESLLVLK